MVIDEVFLSLQGETSFVGIPFLFLRFSGCNLKCSYCDTPAAISQASSCRIHLPTCQKTIPNPLSLQNLKEICADFEDYWWSFTGGEPLLQYQAIEEIVQTFSKPRFWMETNGTLPESITSILLENIQVWSMDIKLPSATGKSLWEIHDDFLQRIIPSKGKIILKTILAENTSLEELESLWKQFLLWSELRSDILLIFQPVTHNNLPHLTEAFSWAYERTLSFPSGRVRIIPQVHPLLRIP